MTPYGCSIVSLLGRRLFILCTVQSWIPLTNCTIGKATCLNSDLEFIRRSFVAKLMLIRVPSPICLVKGSLKNSYCG